MIRKACIWALRITLLVSNFRSIGALDAHDMTGAIFFWPSAVYAKYGGFVGCTFVIGGSSARDCIASADPGVT